MYVYISIFYFITSDNYSQFIMKFTIKKEERIKRKKQQQECIKIFFCLMQQSSCQDPLRRNCNNSTDLSKVIKWIVAMSGMEISSIWLTHEPQRHIPVTRNYILQTVVGKVKGRTQGLTECQDFGKQVFEERP